MIFSRKPIIFGYESGMSNLDSEVLSLARQNRERYLCALTAPFEHRVALLALAAYGSELARIAPLVSEPMLGRIRLQWWIDVLPGIVGGRAPSHPVAGALAQTSFRLDALRMVAEAYAFDFEDGPVTLDALSTFARATGGGMQGLACEALGMSDPDIIEACEDIGTALSLVDGVHFSRRELPEHVAEQALALARQLLDKGRVVHGGKVSDPSARPVLLLARLVERRLTSGANANQGAGAVLSLWWGKLSGRLV